MNTNLSEEFYLEEWASSSRLLFYIIVAISAITLPVLVAILVIMRPHRNSQYYPYMCAIIIANFALLSAVFFHVLSENTSIIYDLLPGFLICKLSVFGVNASSCFIHWTWVAMYSQRFIHVFFPLHSRRKPPRNSWKTIFYILIGSMLVQLWSLLIITELSYKNSQGTYCAADAYFKSSSKTIVLVDSTLTFFIPFLLTVFADISVLISQTPWHPSFKLMSADNLRNNNRSDNIKIVSKFNLESYEKRRSIAIKRCLISATVTLSLNLPNYLLQVIDEFYSLREHPDIFNRSLFLRIDAAFYILYLLQFPLVPLNMYFLRQNITRNSRKLKEKMLLPIEPSNVIELSEATKYQQSATIQE
ncbi:unnamed protein product [Caenorhabditis bovis]|uniref:G-protein coupled receptors family 1 profile domain-containing protein n=1 Tax=Caenorhabditis bovis TaxID=2654633 RepID=A0A8S1EE84_9PELO|nr:unnamed protein product [Caenorhabditis bovis]